MTFDAVTAAKIRAVLFSVMLTSPLGRRVHLVHAKHYLRLQRYGQPRWKETGYMKDEEKKWSRCTRVPGAGKKGH